MTSDPTKTLQGTAPRPEADEESGTMVPTRDSTLDASVVVDGALDERLSPRPGALLSDRYLLKAMVGQGGMGWVFRAHDKALARTVAVKILFPSLAQNEEVFERFTREARSMAGLDHPNVVPVFDVGTHGEWHYYVMKYLEGESLHQRLDGPPLTPAQAIEVALEILEGLDHMHGRGVIHRDIKPSNILLTPEGRAVILDFGILRIDRDTRVTKAGIFVGTPEYVAPELARYAPGDARTDLYSLGITLFEMLTREVPFQGDSPIETVTQQMRDPPRLPSSIERGIPAELDQIVLQALEKDPVNRFQTAAEMRAALLVLTASEARPTRSTPPSVPTQLLPPPRRGRLVRAGALLVLLAAGVALWLGTRTSHVPPRPRRTVAAVPHVSAVPFEPPAPTVPAPDVAPVAPNTPPGEPSAPSARRAAPSVRRAPEKAPAPAPTLVPAVPSATAPSKGFALDRGRAALRSGDGASAVRLFLEASRQSPGSAAPFRGLGDAYLAIGNRTAAIGAYRRYLVLNPNARDAEAVREKLQRLVHR